MWKAHHSPNAVIDELISFKNKNTHTYLLRHIKSVRITADPVKTIELTRPRSLIGIHAAINVDNAGYNGARHNPIKKRTTIRPLAPPTPIAHGVNNVRIADINIPPDKIYFPPNFCAKIPPGNCNRA